MLRQAVVLAGGLGTRLGELTSACPKPMLEVDGRPFLEILINNLKHFGINKIILSAGYLAEVIMEHFGDGSRHGMEITYVVEAIPAGTGGVLDLARDKLDDIFLMLNGDTLFDVNIHELYQLLFTSDATGAIALRQIEDVSRYGAVQTDGDLVLSLSEKGQKGPGYISGGIYVFSKKILDHVKTAPVSLETDILPSVVSKRALVGKAFAGFFIDIGIPESLSSAQTEIPAWEKSLSHS